MARVCRECGGPSTGVLCSTKCRRDFHNRRQKHGAPMFDLFMAIRFERDKATRLDLWTKLCRLASDYRAEDEAEREGRHSWRPAEEVLEALPQLSAQIGRA